MDEVRMEAFRATLFETVEALVQEVRGEALRDLLRNLNGYCPECSERLRADVRLRCRRGREDER